MPWWQPATCRERLKKYIRRTPKSEQAFHDEQRMMVKSTGRLRRNHTQKLRAGREIED